MPMIKENQSLLNKMNIITDVVLLFISLVLSYFIRFFLFETESSYIRLDIYLRFFVIVVPIELIIYGFFDLYSSFRSKPFRKECSLIIQANILLTAILLSILFIFKLVHISRWLIVIFFFINVSLVLLKRFILRQALTSVRIRGYNLKSLLIIGSGMTAKKLQDILAEKKGFGYNYCGYVSAREGLSGSRLGDYSDLYHILENLKPDEVICAMDIEDSPHLSGVVADCEKTGTKISIVPFCYEYIPSHPYIDQFEGIPLINIRRIPLDNLGNAFLKRTMDILGAAILLVIFSPVLLLTAILVKLTSKGPVIFKQTRVGKNKAPFTMYKFRSMRVNDSSDTAWSKAEDERRTKFGSFIRKFSIDELPQLWNVLIGDMSLVGPRPEIPHFVEDFKETIPLYMVKHQVKPGITGLAQVSGLRGDTSIQKRIERDIDYIENWSLLLDFQILFRTLFRGFQNNEILKK